MATITARCKHRQPLGECGDNACTILAIQWRKAQDAPMPPTPVSVNGKRRGSHST